MKLSGIIKNWEDGLISTGEAISQILSHPSATHGYMLDSIAALTLKLLVQEGADAHAFAASWVSKNVS